MPHPVLIAALVAFSLAPAGVAQAAPAHPPAALRQEAPSPHQAVFELSSDDPAGWEALVRNLENVLAHFGPANARLEVVAHGAGIGFLLASDTALAPRLAVLAERGVVFAACNNTMKRKGIAREALLPFVTVVPAGVAEIIEKQEAGWAYLKSGH